MGKRTSRTLRHESPADVGTLWTMRRRESRARCALLSWPTHLELRVVVDGRTLLSESCGRADEAFCLGERWRRRLLDRGWQQVLPGTAEPTPFDGHQGLSPR